MLLSLGMTLVIATGGIDLSVGAVMAIAGAVAAVLIARPEDSPLSVLDVHGSITAVVAIALLSRAARRLVERRARRIRRTCSRSSRRSS